MLLGHAILDDLVTLGHVILSEALTLGHDAFGPAFLVTLLLVIL